MKILITGSSSGIGYGLAKEYLKRGHNVWGIARRTAGELEEIWNYRHLRLDLADEREMKEKLPDFIAGAGHFDKLILNAGILGEIRWMSEIGAEEMKRVMEINVWANKRFLDMIFAAGIKVRHVIGMSSKASLRSSPGWGPYSMSKAGLNMLMNIYAAERPDTHFTSFAPGLVDSEIQENIYKMKDTDKYPTLKRLQEARYTETMPDAESAAPMLIEGMEKALEFDSGSFMDVRDL